MSRPGPDLTAVELRQTVKSIEKLIELSKSVFRRLVVHRTAHDIDVIRQNSPPDERDVDVAEKTADRESALGLGPVIRDGELPKESKTRAKKVGSS